MKFREESADGSPERVYRSASPVRRFGLPELIRRDGPISTKEIT